MPRLSKSQIIKPHKSWTDENEIKIECLNYTSTIYTDIPLLITAGKTQTNLFSNKIITEFTEKQSETNLNIKESIPDEKITILDSQTQEKMNENIADICRVCYENESANNKLVNPCQCAGTCKYIHVKCLKTWINNSFVIPIDKSKEINFKFPKPQCELCEWQYLFKFYFNIGLPQEERCKLVKSIINYFILYLVFVFSCGAVLYLIITSIASLATEKKIHLIIGLVCFALLALIALMVREIKVLQSNKSKMMLQDWGFFNYEDYNDILATEQIINMTDKEKEIERHKLKWVTLLEDHKWYTNLIYRRKQVIILNSNNY